MSMEDILRAARKANGEPIGKPSSPLSPYNPPPEQEDGNDKKNWYKKTWCIILFLIVFYPVGLILLWISPRKSFQLKGLVTVVIIFSVLHFDVGNSFVTRILYPPPVKTERTNEKVSSYQNSNSSNSYDIGYLRSGSTWLDGNGNSHYSSNSAKVEIWNRKIETGNGNLTQIFFLEGKNAGNWGYTKESSLSR